MHADSVALWIQEKSDMGAWGCYGISAISVYCQAPDGLSLTRRLREQDKMCLLTFQTVLLALKINIVFDNVFAASTMGDMPNPQSPDMSVNAVSLLLPPANRTWWRCPAPICPRFMLEASLFQNRSSFHDEEEMFRTAKDKS
ncbi:hypothetical protein I7I51_00472 [Histoplasma capsulatum]|uniref:Uncharacterized protein n=1 Tax=Ajellomyces capsulatus TaxID=5037 RepID=A0A8A1MFM1_AJECA|nr:hypothetical protein I7I51_00472 [Histoplasma capsulatum]